MKVCKQSRRAVISYIIVQSSIAIQFSLVGLSSHALIGSEARALLKTFPDPQTAAPIQTTAPIQTPARQPLSGREAVDAAHRHQVIMPGQDRKVKLGSHGDHGRGAVDIRRQRRRRPGRRRRSSGKPRGAAAQGVAVVAAARPAAAVRGVEEVGVAVLRVMAFPERVGPPAGPLAGLREWEGGRGEG
jgi:hypothetical protein